MTRGVQPQATRRRTTGAERGHIARRGHGSKAFKHILRLAEECPSGPFGDAIRRGACELIEADSWRRRSICRRRMLKSVADLQRRQLHAVSRTDEPNPPMLKRLGTHFGVTIT
jgi:hypothetical protein